MWALHAALAAGVLAGTPAPAPGASGPDHLLVEYTEDISLGPFDADVQRVKFSGDEWFAAVDLPDRAIVHDFLEERSVDVRVLAGPGSAIANTTVTPSTVNFEYSELSATGALVAVAATGSAPGQEGAAMQVIAFRHIGSIDTDRLLYSRSAYEERVNGVALHRLNGVTVICTSAGIKTVSVRGDFAAQNASALYVDPRGGYALTNGCFNMAVTPSGEYAAFESSQRPGGMGARVVAIMQWANDTGAWVARGTVVVGEPLVSLALSGNAGVLSVVYSNDGAAVGSGYEATIYMPAGEGAWQAIHEMNVTSANVAVASGLLAEFGDQPWELFGYAAAGAGDGMTNAVVTTDNFGSASVPSPSLSKVFSEYLTQNQGAFSPLVDLGTQGLRYAAVTSDFRTVRILRGCASDMLKKHYNIPSNGFKRIESATHPECHDACCASAKCAVYQWIEAPPVGTRYPQVQCLLFEEGVRDIAVDDKQPFHTYVMRALLDPDRNAGRDEIADDDQDFATWRLLLLLLAVVCCFVFAAVALRMKSRGLAQQYAADNGRRHNVEGTIDKALLDPSERFEDDPAARADELQEKPQPPRGAMSPAIAASGPVAAGSEKRRSVTVATPKSNDGARGSAAGTPTVDVALVEERGSEEAGSADDAAASPTPAAAAPADPPSARSSSNALKRTQSKKKVRNESEPKS